MEATRVAAPELLSTRSVPASSVQECDTESFVRKAQDIQSVPAVTGLLDAVEIVVPDTAELLAEIIVTPGEAPVESRYATTTAIHCDEPPSVADVVVVAEL
jgi:hypothetical protein